MTLLIPYIPKQTSGITQDIWTKAYNIWVSQLTDLLELDDSAFFARVNTNSDLPAWIQSVLETQLDQGGTDSRLLHLIFLIYMRLGDSVTHSDVIATSPLTSITSLDTFSMVFARANPVMVRKLFSQVFSTQTTILDQYGATVEQLIDTLESTGGYISSLDGGDGQQIGLERILVVARLLETKVLCLDAYIPRLFSVLMTCHGGLVDTFASTIDDSAENQVGYWIYLVKQSLTNILQRMVEIKYLAPLGYAMVGQSGQLQKLNDGDAIVMALHDQLIEWVEQSELDSHKTVFVDAPLIMDWQVEWQVSKMLEDINQGMFSGENEQLSFLVLVMEGQIQDLAQGTQQSWGQRLKDQNYQPTYAVGNSVTTSDVEPIADDMERTSLISQVRDIFSDLGEGFVEACLVANNDDAEMVIMQLLENNLPPSLASLDRSMPRTAPLPAHSDSMVADHHPQHNLLESRKNIFDKDEFDVFSGKIVEQSKAYTGKKNHGTAESLLDSKTHTKDEKANMLRRIYDMYEDEIDDSYDSVNEIAGPVDLAAIDEGGQALDVVRAKKDQTVDPGVLNESELVHMYVDHPQVFDRSSATRKSAQRDALRKRTNMTDEQLEGWAIMFNRNPRKQRILDKYMLFDGSQDQVGAGVKSKQQEQQQQGASSKPPPMSEAKQRSYKDKNKGRFGNHNRKKNHTKKLKNLAGPTPNAS